MSSTTLIIVIVVIVLAAAIAVVGYRVAQQKRSVRLREQYGPEYDRALDQADSQRDAEAELRERSKRHEKELRGLTLLSVRISSAGGRRCRASSWTNNAVRMLTCWWWR